MGIYAAIPYYQYYFSRATPWPEQTLRGWDVLLVAVTGYAFLLFAYYLFERTPQASKSVTALRLLWRLASNPVKTLRSPLNSEERLALLSVLLKAFFAPLMVVWLFEHSALLFTNGQIVLNQWFGSTVSWQGLANAETYWLVFRLIVFADVLFFTLGYLIELPTLNNTIRSVDPTFLGWGVALACYPPFNGLTSSMFGWHSTEFPQFIGHPVVHMVANLALLGLMAIYSWSSVALNFKASNLTHRGIISHGPYRWVRHPAYVAKNLAWWIGLGPALIVGMQGGWTETLLIAGSMFGWTFIYYMRAVTEEDHLRSVDDSYDQYCKRVKYRFIPYLI